MEPSAIELTGTTTWNPDVEMEAQFSRFILKSDGFSFELNYERSRYSGIFKRTHGDRFEGKFEARGDGGRRTGRGTCQLVQRDDLFEVTGEWYEKEEGDAVERCYLDWRAELYAR
jgi:hypothetical protein